VPGLLLRIPEHPQIPEQEDDRREDPGEVAEDATTEADRAAAREVDDANAKGALSDRLTGGAAFEIAVVPDTDCKRRDPADRASQDRLHHELDDPEHDPVDDGCEESLEERRARS
jgi:hypothetical protein